MIDLAVIKDHRERLGLTIYEQTQLIDEVEFLREEIARLRKLLNLLDEAWVEFPESKTYTSKTSVKIPRTNE